MRGEALEGEDLQRVECVCVCVKWGMGGGEGVCERSGLTAVREASIFSHRLGGQTRGAAPVLIQPYQKSRTSPNSTRPEKPQSS